MLNFISHALFLQGKPKGKDVADNEGNSCAKKCKQAKHKSDEQKHENEQFTWENKLIEDKVKPLDSITHAVILDIEGRVKAAMPDQFEPDPQGIQRLFVSSSYT
jgi:hypothetical protein